MPPSKTAEGHAELAHRSRRLSQRHRTVLLLVDGQRSAAEVRRLAAAAGAPQSCFDELVTLGLIDGGADGSDTGSFDTDSMAPTEPLLGESGWIGFDSARQPAVDRPLEEARGILLRAVRREAPVTGALTIRKLKRAANRDELEALLEEVELRIAKPRKLIVAAQMLRHVRHLLTLPADGLAE